MEIYLDNSATSFPKPESVYQAMDAYMRNNGASAGRGNYKKAMAADRLIYDARKTVAKLLGAPRPGQIVFTANATDGLNMALRGLLSHDDIVLTSNIEHNALWRPLNALAKERAIRIETFSVSRDGIVDLDEVAEKITGKTKLVACLHGSNVLGNILPIKEIAEIAHNKNVPVLVDGAQTAGVYPIDLTALDVDFFVFTGHKGLLGPMGIGGIYIKEGSSFQPSRQGGTGANALSEIHPDIMPEKYEAGTMNMPGIVGLQAGAAYICREGIENIWSHEITLMEQLIKGLKDISGLAILGPEDPACRLGLVSFTVNPLNPDNISAWLDEHYRIMVRAGLHCAPQAHRVAGTVDTGGAIRVSVGCFTTGEEVDFFIKGLRDCINALS